MNHLDRFVDAQAPLYEQALEELRSGRKRTHWMWFVFPQLRGLGQSAMAQHYGIASREEAHAYLAHPLLGERLRQCVAALQALPPDSDAEGVLGGTDALKLRSSLTLFEAVAPQEPLFGQALDRWYDGQRDARTLAMLRVP